MSIFEFPWGFPVFRARAHGNVFLATVPLVGNHCAKLREESPAVKKVYFTASKYRIRDGGICTSSRLLCDVAIAGDGNLHPTLRCKKKRRRRVYLVRAHFRGRPNFRPIRSKYAPEPAGAHLLGMGEILKLTHHLVNARLIL